MIKARQHRPNFVQTDDPLQTAQAESGRELIDKNAWICEWKYDPGFYRFSVNTNRVPFGHEQHLLMAEFKEGAEWHVVAYLSEPPADLPQWAGPPDKPQTPVASIRP